jgi:hypothetical protein
MPDVVIKFPNLGYQSLIGLVKDPKAALRFTHATYARSYVAEHGLSGAVIENLPDQPDPGNEGDASKIFGYGVRPRA